MTRVITMQEVMVGTKNEIIESKHEGKEET